MTKRRITDAQVERACRIVWDVKPLGTVLPDLKRRMGEALEAALDRRTGPKCRRAEQDDTGVYGQRGVLSHGANGVGRRSGDKSWMDLPKKSSRLAREAAEEPPHKVSVSMMAAGRESIRLFEYEPRGKSINPEKHYLLTLHDVIEAHRAMERVRREELKGSAEGNESRLWDSFVNELIKTAQEAAPYGALLYRRSGPGRASVTINERSGRSRRKGDPK